MPSFRLEIRQVAYLFNNNKFLFFSQTNDDAIAFLYVSQNKERRKEGKKERKKERRKKERRERERERERKKREERERETQKLREKKT